MQVTTLTLPPLSAPVARPDVVSVRLRGPVGVGGQEDENQQGQRPGSQHLYQPRETTFQGFLKQLCDC